MKNDTHEHGDTSGGGQSLGLFNWIAIGWVILVFIGAIVAIISWLFSTMTTTLALWVFFWGVVVLLCVFGKKTGEDK